MRDSWVLKQFKAFIMQPSLFDRIIVKIYNILRKPYRSIFGEYHREHKNVCNDATVVNNKIFALLNSKDSCMIARFGNNELECTIFGRNRLHYRYHLISYLSGESDIWWYPTSIVKKMFFNAGFFTPTLKQLNRFSKEMIKSMSLVDVLGSWIPNDESYFTNELENAFFVNLELLSPLWCGDAEPWTMALAGKRVLVVHPFVETIKKQYSRRELIHKDVRTLPDFELLTIKSVQSITGVKPDDFNTWFDALQYMEDQIDKIDYDVCLIGCGAYGFLLAAHCKMKGKKAVHLGGALQLLFGIKGKRWEDPNYGFAGKNYLSFMNEYWVRPSKEETPTLSNSVEGSCYW